MRWTPIFMGLALLAGCDRAPEPVPDETIQPQEGMIWVDNAQIVLPVVDGRPGVAYMTIRNGSTVDIELVGIAIPGTDRTELHESTTGDGVMAMEKIETIVIPSGSSATLERGGLHAMVFGIDANNNDETTDIVLEFSNGSSLSVTASVARIGKDQT